MNEATLRETLDDRPHGLLEPQPPGALGQGRHVGRPPVSCARRSSTATATSCCSWSSRRARAPATPASTRVSSGIGRDLVRQAVSDFHALARSHTVVPVWREVLADSPRRWRRSLGWPAPMPTANRASSSSRSSTASGGAAGRSSAAVRRPPLSPATAASRSRVASTPLIPTDRGVLAALEQLLATYRSPSLPELPPLHGGVVGYLGYDVVREVERLPDVPADDHGLPDAVLSVIGELAAYRPLAPAGHLDRATSSSTAAGPRPNSTTPTTPPCAASTTSPPTAPARSTSPCWRRPIPPMRCPTSSATVSSETYGRGCGRGQGAHPGRRHLPGGAVPALRPRPRRRPVRRLPGRCARSTRARTCTSCATPR